MLDFQINFHLGLLFLIILESQVSIMFMKISNFNWQQCNFFKKIFHFEYQNPKYRLISQKLTLTGLD